MQDKLSPRLAIVILILASTSFGANHVAARVAFDHGASVAMGVLTRATGTALVLLLLMKLQSVPISVPRPLLPRLAVAGALIAVQSFCIYSAVAVIPAALALLVFQTSAMLYLMLTWVMGREKPSAIVLLPMLAALVGLMLVLDLRIDQLSARWQQIGVGVTWAFASACSMAVVYYFNAFALKELDGRLRTFGMTAVTAAVVLAGGAAGDLLALPRDATGYLGLALLTVFYCIAMTTAFMVIPRVGPSSAIAFNFEPIALLVLAWAFLGQAVTPLQVVGVFITVGAITWVSRMSSRAT
jgi:drug/metabolite transporter (DMT)-like permease